MSSVKEKKRLLKGLNPAQKEAVSETLDQPSLVIAGAGSGKTSVLTKRVAYLKLEGVLSKNILTVTFTNKAAKEMRERIGYVIGEEKAKKIAIGTFHSLCNRWLRQFGRYAGLKSGFTIFDADDCDKLIKGVLKDMNIDSTAASIYAHKSFISDLKNKMITPERYRTQARAKHEQEMYQVYKRYDERLRANNGVDFDDLIMIMVNILESTPEVREKFQKRFKYVMVDEYQDTNEAQYRLIKNIVGKKNNIFVVGDDYQSIYGWRGADINKILNFQKDYPNTKIVKLEQNYRSTQTIVEAGNAIMRANKEQMHKTCFSKNPVGEKIRIYTAHDDHQEADFIRDEIHRLVALEGYDYKDIAILMRVNHLSRLLEDRFMVGRIPYEMVSGFSFYERKEIKDILAWLQIAANPDNDLACERILGMMPGLGATTIKGMVDYTRKTTPRPSLYDVVETFTPKQAKAKAALAMVTNITVKLNNLHNAGKGISDTPITDMLTLIFRHTGYLEKLRDSGKEEDERRIDNIMELQKIAGGYEEEVANPSVQDFLDQITLVSQQDKVSGEDTVKIMTLHSAKGLEYPVVFMMGCEEGILPHSRSLIGSHDNPELAEERRLAYVGITRAKELLYMTNADRRMGFDRQYKNTIPSRFFRELPDHLVEEV